MYGLSSTSNDCAPLWRRTFVGMGVATLLAGLGFAAWDLMRPKTIVHGISVPPSYDAWRRDMFIRRVREIEAMPVQAHGIAFYGDSLTQWGDWDNLLQDTTIMNFGVRGDRTNGALNRLPQLIAAEPRKVILMIGTNDLEGGLRTPAQIVVAQATILDQIERALPETKIVVQSVLPREAQYQDEIESLRVELRQMVEARDIKYLDLTAAFADSSGALREDLTTDGLHLNDAGYALWAAKLEPILKNQPLDDTDVEIE